MTRSRRPNLRRLYAAFAALSIFASAFSARADDLGILDKEQLELQRELSWLTALMWGLVVGLVMPALMIRVIARRTTHPCHWCMEFIPNSADACPRCGKKAPAQQKGA